MMSVFSEIKSCKTFSMNEKHVGEYILDNPEKVLSMNSHKLAEACFVSQSTVYRFCSKLELTGFSELKMRISQSLKDYQQNKTPFDFDFPVKEHQTHYEIIHKLQETYEKNIQSTVDLIDFENLRYIIRLMSKAQKIDIYTSAGNIYFAENFKFQMQEIGIDVNVPIDEYMQRLQASQSDENHFAIVISFSGRGLMTKRIRNILKKGKVPTLLICSPDYDDSECEADYKLYFSPYENHYKKISSYSTRLSLLYILDVIYTCYFELDYTNNIRKKLDYYNNM